MYIYDSYVFPSSAWWELLSERGNLTLRGTELDAIYIGLLVESQHRNHIKKSHFDGFYTYFGINGFSYGSSWKNWKDLNKFANQNGLLFIPSLGPGYIDTQVSGNIFFYLYAFCSLFFFVGKKSSRGNWVIGVAVIGKIFARTLCI